jgi:16S rRNA (cytosine967-C5)-methyltransferase
LTLLSGQSDGGGMSGSPEASPPAAGLASRQAAVAILSQVLRRKRPLDQAAAEILAGSSLAPRDWGFARAIAAASLRRFGQLEALIRAFVPKTPPPHKAGPTLEILIAGAAELLFLNVPAHAAVDAANRLAQSDLKAVHFKALINAVLRRVAAEGPSLLAQQDAAALNAPDWLFERWIANYGEAQARLVAEAHLAIPPLDLTLQALDAPYTDFNAALRLVPGRVRLKDAGKIENLPGFQDGRWWVQDFAASLPAMLFGDVAGRTVIDLCAAPGGKTLQLASVGARVTAVDAVSERLALIADNLARTKLSADLIAADARDWRPEAASPFVLLDAPCTATGTIRRHPDLPWLKTAADLVSAESLQSELLDAAGDMTAAGGILVYAVCSLEPEEGVEQIDSFLRRRSDFARSELSPSEAFDRTFITPKGDLATLPFYWAEKGGMDGFYAARLKRLL